LATSSQTDLLAVLRRHARDTSPFADQVPRVDADGARWLEPRVVVDVRYLDHSENGRLRQPVFLGLRTDLDPADVIDPGSY
jgi:bifunctional non-homologous end joining protein LigD